MASPRPPGGRSAARRQALAGLAGAALAAVGDVLILGRAASGSEFDRAVGVLPPHVEVGDRWRSLWNGAARSRRRIQVGTVTGVVGIGVLAGTGMRGALRGLRPDGLRHAATASVAAFAVSGVLTHLSCGWVILAYRQALESAPDPGATDPGVPDPRVPHPSGPAGAAPRPPTALFAVSAAGALSALAVFSGSLGLAALRDRGTGPGARSAVTAFPSVVAALLTFGRLPAPLGGYARPASISIGLLAYSCLAAAMTAGEADAEGATRPVVPEVRGPRSTAPACRASRARDRPAPRRSARGG